MYSGLFFLAPGVGFLAGSVVSGHLSDRCVVRYKARRDGVRFAEDRLNSTLPWFFVVLPFGTLLYGWSVDQEVGGMGLPISSSFIEGFGLMAAFNGLNTYAAGKLACWTHVIRNANLEQKYIHSLKLLPLVASMSYSMHSVRLVLEEQSR